MTGRPFGVLVVLVALVAGCMDGSGVEEQGATDCAGECLGPTDPGTEDHYGVEVVATEAEGERISNPFVVNDELAVWTVHVEASPGHEHGYRVLEAYDLATGDMHRLDNASLKIMGPILDDGVVYLLDISNGNSIYGQLISWRPGHGEPTGFSHRMMLPSHVDYPWAVGHSWAVDLRDGTSQGFSFAPYTDLWLDNGSAYALPLMDRLSRINLTSGQEERMDMPRPVSLIDYDDGAFLLYEYNATTDPTFYVMRAWGEPPGLVDLSPKMHCTSETLQRHSAHLDWPWIAYRCAPFKNGDDLCQAYNIETGQVVQLGQIPLLDVHAICLLGGGWMWSECWDGDYTLRGEYYEATTSICRVPLPDK